MNFSQKLISSIENFCNVYYIVNSFDKSVSLVVKKGYYPLCVGVDCNISEKSYIAISGCNNGCRINVKTLHNAFLYIKKQGFESMCIVNINNNIYHIGFGCIFDESYKPLVLTYKRIFNQGLVRKEIIISPRALFIKEINDFISKKFIPIISANNIGDIIISNKIDSLVRIVKPLKNDFKQDVDKKQKEAWDIIEDAVNNKLVLINDE